VISDISAPSILFLFFIFSAYLLAAASLGPLYGKLSDLIGELAECTMNSKFIICFRTKAYIIRFYYHLLGMSHVFEFTVILTKLFILDWFCIMWCCSKYDMAYCMSCNSRHRRRRHHPTRPDHNFRHCGVARVRLVIFMLSNHTAYYYAVEVNTVD
jgi:hypothetical protein